MGNDLDPVFKALANPLRRKILDMLRDGPLTTGDLDAAFPEHTRYAVMQHLDVLERADLVVAVRSGKRRFNHLNAVPIRRVYERWVSRYAGHWSAALVSLKATLERERTPPDERRPAARSDHGPGEAPRPIYEEHSDD